MIISAQYFQYSSHWSPYGSHVFHGETVYTYSRPTPAWTRPKYAVFVHYSTGQYRFPQNSAKTQKFCVNEQILQLCSKFHRKLVSINRMEVSVVNNL